MCRALRSRSWQGELYIVTQKKKNGSYVNEEARSIRIICEFPFYLLIPYVSNFLCLIQCLMLSSYVVC